MSNIPHVPTEKNRATVGMMVLAGVDRDTIAAALKITKPTLRKYYKRELDEAKAHVDAEMASSLIKLARGGNVAAVIFYLKTRCGWSEKSQVEHTASKTLADLVRESEAAAKNSTEEDEEEI